MNSHADRIAQYLYNVNHNLHRIILYGKIVTKLFQKIQNCFGGDLVSEENKQPKRKVTDFHLMVFVDNSDGGVHQMSIGRQMTEIILGILAGIILICAVGWGINSHFRKTYKNQRDVLAAQVEELSSQVADLSTERDELSNKVVILSDTVNSKVEQETAVQEEHEAAHYPEGFPLSASASMSTDADLPNTLIFTCNSGSSIISTGAGTVIEVLPDAEYGYCIRIDHGNDYVTEYYNGATPLIKEGDEVLQGAILSVVENNDSKLIYKIYKSGELVDPLEVIKIDG